MRSFVLCERSSGAVRFRVEADPDGSMPVEKIAGLLAVHCLVRGQAPEDYELLVVPRESLLDAAAERAQELLAAGRALGAGVKVSRREQEVLDCIVQGFTNKEIAAKLNVAERTVKFHVSSLLAKFGVADRVALSREASLGRMPSHSATTAAYPGNLVWLFGPRSSSHGGRFRCVRCVRKGQCSPAGSFPLAKSPVADFARALCHLKRGGFSAA